jgi:hypothetical protein
MLLYLFPDFIDSDSYQVNLNIQCHILILTRKTSHMFKCQPY